MTERLNALQTSIHGAHLVVEDMQTAVDTILAESRKLAVGAIEDVE